MRLFRFPQGPIRRGRTLLLAGLVWAVTVSAALAAQPSLSPAAHQSLSQAQTLLQDSKWKEAEAALRGVTEKFAREPYAVALAWQMRGYLLNETGRHQEALQAFEKALQLDALDAPTRQQVRYNVAHLLVGLGRPAEAVRHVDAWLADSEIVTPEQRVRAAWIYLGAQRYETAAGLLEAAIQAEEKPAETWYQLLLAAHQGAGNHAALKRWLPVVIERFPRNKLYWQQLSAVHLHLKEDRRAAATLLAAYHNGLLQEAADILHLARFCLYVGVPHKAARVLQQALEEGKIEAAPGHYELLADSWALAQEPAGAVAALERAVRAGGGPEMSLKLGRLLLQQEEWQAAVEPLRRAATAEKEKVQGEALLLLGMAAYQSGQPDEARTAFQKARSHAGARRQAESWLRYLGGG